MNSLIVDLKRFFKKIALLLIPFIFFFLPTSWILFQSGELTSVEEAIKEQNTQKQLVVYGLAYTQDIESFKLRSVLARSPEVLILGTSRVLSIRTAFFDPKYNCYNAGKGISTLKEMKGFLARIPISHSPKLVILGLDQYFFNENWSKKNLRDTSKIFDFSKEWYKIVGQASIHTKIYSDLLEKKFDLADIFKREGIGLMAKATGYGYLNNGDMLGLGKNIEDENFTDTFKRIKEGNNRFEYGSIVSEKSMTELNDILLLCKQRGIHVVAFIPPFAQAIYQEMLRRSSQYAYIWKLESELRPCIEKYNFSFFDFTNLQDLSGDNPEYYDGFHASEKAYLRLFIKMVEQDNELAKYTNVYLLRQRLVSSSSDLFVFSAEESLRGREGW